MDSTDKLHILFDDSNLNHLDRHVNLGKITLNLTNLISLTHSTTMFRNLLPQAYSVHQNKSYLFPELHELHGNYLVFEKQSYLILEFQELCLEKDKLCL